MDSARGSKSAAQDPYLHLFFLKSNITSLLFRRRRPFLAVLALGADTELAFGIQK